MTMHYAIGAPASLGAFGLSRRKRARRTMLASLMLTPMVDMFSLMVIFLLQFFSASPDFSLTDGVILPQSASTAELKDAPIVAVSKDAVYVDAKRIGSVAELLKQPAPLVQALDAVKATWLAAHPKDVFPGEVNLEAHQELESTQISQLMAILAAQQFGSIQLVAIGD